jgi:hypothetical protein
MPDEMGSKGEHASVQRPLDKESLLMRLRQFQEVVRLLGDRVDPEANPAKEDVAG